MICKVVQHPDNALRTVCSTVLVFDSALRSISENLINTMRYNIGVGLAAPQINVLKRIIVVELNNRAVVMVNPVIVACSAKLSTIQEGCLSIPGVSCNIARSEEIEIKYQDLSGADNYFLSNGLTAHIIQHEIDHLLGRLIIDYEQL